MARRPWRVVYSPDPGREKHRSKPFDSEDDALGWAGEFVRWRAAPASAHVYAKAMDDVPDLDPVPSSHRVAWINGAVSIMSWPEMPREQYERWSRQMIDSYLGGEYVGPRWVPEHLAQMRGPLPGPRRID